MGNLKKYFILCMIFIIPALAQEYAFAYIENGSGTNTVGTTWVNIGAGGAQDLTLAMASTHWSLNTNQLLAADNPAVEGVYCIKYSLSFNADAADWYIGISIDGANPVEPVFMRSIGNSRKDAGNISGIFVATISQGQTIELVVKSDGSNNDFTPIYSQLSVCPAAMMSVNSFAGMHISNDATYNNIGTTITKITNFIAVPEMNGWTSSGGELTAGTGAGGLYYLSYSVSFTGDGNESSPIEYIFDVLKNDNEGVSHILANRSSSSLDIGNISGGGLINISDGDVIALGVKANLNNNSLIIRKANISMFRLGDTTPNSIGGMTITSDQTITIPAQNSWVTVGNYGLEAANNWSLGSNVFTPTSADAVGYYYLEYTTSLTTTNSGGDDIELAVFIDGVQSSELTTSRRLSSSSDVGADCGVGLLSIEDQSQSIEIKIRNTTSGSNLTIKKSMLGFSQIQLGLSEFATAISLDKFTANMKQRYVELTWSTKSESNNAAFLIYRNGKLITSIEGAGNSSETKDYYYFDKTVIPGNTYTYVLADLDYANYETKHLSKSQTITVDDNVVETDFHIDSVYPNPFNPITTCSIHVHNSTHVNVSIYDSKANLVKVINDAPLSAGTHNLIWNAADNPSGIYFIVVSTDNAYQNQKLVLIK